MSEGLTSFFCRSKIVTGSNAGVDKEVTQSLYSKRAKVYVAARSEKKASRAIADMKKAWPQSNGMLFYQHLDLSDLATIKTSVERFTSQESKLLVLFNNAGLQTLNPEGLNKTTQGHEIHLRVSVVGNFLFTKLQTQIVVATAKAEPPNAVRVVWVLSLATEMVGENS